MYKIALLDDDPSWNGAVTRFFTRHGFEVQAFTDVKAFLSQASNCDLALIDFYLTSNSHTSTETSTDVNGYVIIRQLRQTLEHCPILVLVSAFVDMESTRLFPEADFFLVKDIGLDVILQRTRELLEYRQIKATEPVS